MTTDRVTITFRLQAEEMTVTRQGDGDHPPEIIDVGLVGKVVKVNPQVLHALEHGRFIPIIAPLGVGPEGESLNMNADLVASAMSSGLRASKLVLLTDTPGVLDADGNLIPELTREKAHALLKDGTIAGGMIPKVNCCLEALDAGVKSAHIIDGRVPNALLLEIFTDKGVGTILEG